MTLYYFQDMQPELAKFVYNVHNAWRKSHLPDKKRGTVSRIGACENFYYTVPNGTDFLPAYHDDAVAFPTFDFLIQTIEEAS